MEGKNSGIFIAHAMANLIDLNSNKKKFTLTSDFSYEVTDKAMHKNENLMHNKRQKMDEAFYKKLENRLKNIAKFCYLALVTQK